MEAISLFAGAGGCSLGFSKSGVNILAAFDNFEPAIKTYNKNFSGNKCHNLDLASCDFQQVRNGLSLNSAEKEL